MTQAEKTRPPLASFDDGWEGDAVAELIYDTLCDRGVKPAAAAAALAVRYDYDEFGKIVDHVEDHVEDEEES